MDINERSKFKHLTAFILVLLAEKNYSPREVKKSLLENFPGFTRDMSTVYRCLSSLEKEGLVTVDWHLPNGGAAKKIYSLTEKGWEALYEWKEDIVIRKRNFEVFLKKFENLLEGEK
ncbi:PadR family transcriptional regulator [Fusobacterium animalis]|nr:PadR family transcriptional regulator [Fusobacterium nucleatum]